jgi:hypothetical protein
MNQSVGICSSLVLNSRAVDGTSPETDHSRIDRLDVPWAFWWRGGVMSQRSRRQDPYPWTWEMPLAVILAVFVLISFGVHLGRAVANVVAGCDWRFPSRANLFSSLPAVLHGDAGAGLVDLHGPGASPSSLLMCVAATELILLAATMALIKLGLDRWGPGRMKGVATPGEAEKLLGATRLRRSRRIIRPDLYGKRRQGLWR